jgi:hypothetical protein
VSSNETARHDVATSEAGLDGGPPREQTGNDRITLKRFEVLTVRYDGRTTRFNCYDTRAEAEAVARTLRSVGCGATVEESP